VPGRVDFVHRTFLEYLAAEEAVQQHHIQTLIAHAHLDNCETQSLASTSHRVLVHLPTSHDGMSDAQVAPTVRAAALTGATEAVPLPARYARDTRDRAERGWSGVRSFEPERYAE